MESILETIDVFLLKQFFKLLFFLSVYLLHDWIRGMVDTWLLRDVQRE